MGTPGEPASDAASGDSNAGTQQPKPTARRRKAKAAASAQQTQASVPEQQPQATVAIAVEVPVGMVVMAVTPTEAQALERSRARDARGRILRAMPRDWTTPLALLIPLLAALVTGISDSTEKTGFLIAAAAALVWLILSVIGRCVDAVQAHGARTRRPPVLR
jgi:hypothetical protein